MNYCALCGTKEELRDSHVFPKFIINHFKKTSPTGYLVLSNQPNRRQQDGEKLKLLCEYCEQKLSKDERLFAANIHRPITSDGKSVVKYGNYHHKFACGLIWKYLAKCYKHNEFKPIKQWKIDEIDKCFCELTGHLLGHTDKPGQYRVHFMYLGITDKVDGSVPRYFNRYLTRVIDGRIFSSNKSIFVYRKMMRYLYIMPIVYNGPRWKNTRLPYADGEIKPRDMHITNHVWEMIEDGCRMYERSKDAESPARKEKLKALRESDPNKFMDTEVYLAWKQDMEQQH